MKWITIWNRECTCTRKVFFFFFSKERVLIQLLLFCLSELVLRVTTGLEVGNVLLTDQTTNGQSAIF